MLYCILKLRNGGGKEYLMQLGKWTFRATDTTHLYFSGLKRGESTHVTLGVVCQRGGWARARSRKPAQLMTKKVREWESKFTPLLFDITAPSLSALLSYFPDSPTRKSTRGTPKVKLERQPIMYISGRLCPSAVSWDSFNFTQSTLFRGPLLLRSELLPQ